MAAYSKEKLSMATSVIREWTGIQQFPPATQTKLLELLGKLKQEDYQSIVSERAVIVNAFQSKGPRPVMVSRSRAGFTLNIIDTPGLVEDEGILVICNPIFPLVLG